MGEREESVVVKTNPREIEVIAIFDQSGDIRPLRLRMEDETGERKIIRIDRVLQKDVEKIAGNVMIKYRCQSVLDHQERIFEVKYEKDTYKWYLFKM